MNIFIQNKEYLLEKPTLKKWIELEDIRGKIIEAAEAEDIDEISSLICSHVSAALDLPLDIVSSASWIEIAIAYNSITLMCMPKYNFALMKTKIKEEKVVWDYDGRTFYVWADMIAGKYGWNLDYISSMDFDESLALVQEILVNDQLEREWQYGLSELAYPYNPSTKKSEFKPLPRPDWMKGQGTSKALEPTKIRKDMMPVGAVMRMDGTHEILAN